MNVLITGGCGFIGSHAAEAFIKEGHEVCVIDNLSSGKKKNLKLKHSFYQLDICDKVCDRIFKIHHFDVVVHLADAKMSSEGRGIDVRDNIDGLANLLSLSSKYKIKKFIYVSTGAVYGDSTELPCKEEQVPSPSSSYGISKYIGEQYVEQWGKVYGLDYVILRLSHVYGPRETAGENSSVVSKILDKIASHETVEICDTDNQELDFIYVEDVAQAIYKSSYSTISKILNISSQAKTSLSELYTKLQEITGYDKVTFVDKKTKDIYHMLLDNTKAKTELDWAPLCSLEEGLKKTYEWHKKEYKEKKKTENQKKLKERIKSRNGLFLYIENILIFIVFAFLSYRIRSNIYNTNPIDLMILYIALIAIFHNFKQTAIAVGLSVVNYFVQNMMYGSDITMILYGLNTLLTVIMYSTIGIGVGYLIEKKNEEIEEHKRICKQKENDYNLLAEIYEQNVAIREKLKSQILGYEDSFGKIFSIVSALNTLAPEKIFQEAVNIVSEIFKADGVAVYIVDKTKSYLRLMASNNINYSPKNTFQVSESEEISWVVNNREMFVNKELKPDVPVIISPILNNNEVIALIFADGIEFESLTLSFTNLFNIVMGLITQSLVRAYEYEQATYSQRYIEDTLILKNEWYKKIKQIRKEGEAKKSCKYTELVITTVPGSLIELSRKLSPLIRSNDYIGVDDNSTVRVLLSNTDHQGAQNVVKRLMNAGLNSEIVEDER